MTDFSREVDSTVASALNPGEKALWTGHCLSRLGQQRKAARTVPWAWIFAVVFTGAGVATLLSMLANGGVSYRLLGPGLILVIGAALARSLVDEQIRDSAMYCRKQTVYVLTDQRAFILRHCRTDAPMRSVAWRYIDHVQAERVELDGRGTVKFRRWNPGAHQWDTLLQFSRVGNANQVAEWAHAVAVKAHG